MARAEQDVAQPRRQLPEPPQPRRLRCADRGREPRGGSAQPRRGDLELARLEGPQRQPAQAGRYPDRHRRRLCAKQPLPAISWALVLGAPDDGQTMQGLTPAPRWRPAASDPRARTELRGAGTATSAGRSRSASTSPSPASTAGPRPNRTARRSSGTTMAGRPSSPMASSGATPTASPTPSAPAASDAATASRSSCRNRSRPSSPTSRPTSSARWWCRSPRCSARMRSASVSRPRASRRPLTDSAGAAKLAALGDDARIARGPIISVDGPDGSVEGWRQALAPHPTASTPVATGPDDPALMIFTSGTTGPPKGALHGHRGPRRASPRLRLHP